jgi:hypothetical protein
MRAALATVTLAFAVALIAVPAPAEYAAASHYHRHQHAGAAHRVIAGHDFPNRRGDPRPRAWCGWYMRQLMHVADRSYNLARNWTHWGRALAGPQIGAIVVWPHHVGKIVGRIDTRWLVLSGNDGHAVRTRARSLAGAIAFRI